MDKKQINPEIAIGKFKSIKQLLKVFPEKKKFDLFIGKRVREERKNRNLSLRELEKKAGLSHGTIGNMEARGSMNIYSLAKVLAVFDMTFDELLRIEKKSEDFPFDLTELGVKERDEFYTKRGTYKLLTAIHENIGDINLLEVVIALKHLTEKMPDVVRLITYLSPKEYELLNVTAKFLLSQYDEEELKRRVNLEFIE